MTGTIDNASIGTLSTTLSLSEYRRRPQFNSAFAILNLLIGEMTREQGTIVNPIFTVLANVGGVGALTLCQAIDYWHRD